MLRYDINWFIIITILLIIIFLSYKNHFWGMIGWLCFVLFCYIFIIHDGKDIIKGSKHEKKKFEKRTF
jgi:hypothetical protein